MLEGRRRLLRAAKPDGAGPLEAIRTRSLVHYNSTAHPFVHFVTFVVEFDRAPVAHVVRCSFCNHESHEIHETTCSREGVDSSEQRKPDECRTVRSNQDS